MTQVTPPLADEMPAKLTQIERLAREKFIETLQANKLTFGPGDSIIADPLLWTDPLVGGHSDPASAMQTFADQWGIVLSDLATLRTRVEEFYQLEPIAFTIMVGMLGGTSAGPGSTVVAGLNGPPTSVYARLRHADSQWMQHVDNLINEKQWTGAAATAFQENFLAKFRAASEQQQAYAQVLAVTPQAWHEGVVTAFRYLLTIADTCVNRLNGDAGAGGQAFEVEVLSWTSMITGALSLFPPVAPVAGPISLASGVGGYARGKQSEPPNEAPIPVGPVWTVIEATLREVASVTEGLLELDTALAGILNANLGSPVVFASSGLRLERPDLAEGPATMGTLTIDRPEVINNNDVAVSVADVYRAGYVNLPGAAGQYTAAGEKLALCEPSGAARQYFPRSVPAFVAARDELGGILRTTAESLSACGSALVATAEGYQLTDEESATYTNLVGALVQPQADPEPTPLRGPI